MADLTRRTPANPVLSALNRWLADHPGKTHQTYLDAYKRVLPYLQAAPLSPERVVEIREDLLRRYRPTTVQLTLRAMSSLWNQFRDAGLVRDNPWTRAGKQVPVQNQRARRLLMEDDIRRLIAACNGLEETALIRFLLYTGLRLHEAATATWADLRRGDDGKWRITVLGKGGKTRTVVVPARVVWPLQFLAQQRGATRPEDRILWWSERNIQYHIARIGRRAGLDRAISPHWLRHAYATQALNHGAPLHLVQASLGHAKLTTTGIYADAAPTESAGDYVPDTF